MATYVLIHGAGSDSWYWHLVTPLLQARGHHVVAPDLPCDDDAAGWVEYTDCVLAAIGPRRDLVVVGQSMAGFTAPLVCDRVPARLLVLVAAMTPVPGESAGDWWRNTGQPDAMRAQAERDGRVPTDPPDLRELFFHDVPEPVLAQAFERGEKPQSGTPFGQPWPLTGWPGVPTRFLLCTQDRLFPADFQRRMARDRLGLVPDELEAGHLPALGHPDQLVERLEQFRLDQERLERERAAAGT
jgi:pimeloyl-ACP methyl ester carboxylesterase